MHEPATSTPLRRLVCSSWPIGTMPPPRYRTSWTHSRKRRRIWRGGAGEGQGEGGERRGREEREEEGED